MDNQPELETLFRQHGFTDFRWIDPQRIVVAQWVRMKCMFACGIYGKCASCPPNVPSVAECERFFREYRQAVVLHFHKHVDKPEDRHAWTRQLCAGLLQVEREVFLAGHERAFLLFMDHCTLCADCPGERALCAHPMQSRPTLEAMAIDVYTTVRQIGYPIQVLTDYTQAMNRYAMLLIQ